MGKQVCPTKGKVCFKCTGKVCFKCDFFIGVVNDVSDINDEISVQLLVEESDSSKWGFQHKTSSPVYPQSNGLAERTVQTVKNLLQKAKASGEDPYLTLLSYRNTTVSDACSPAQLLMNRRLRTDLPTTSKQLVPKILNRRHVQNCLTKRKIEQKHLYYDLDLKRSETYAQRRPSANIPW